MWKKFTKIATTILIAVSFVYAFVFSLTGKYDQATFFLVLAFLIIYLQDTE